MLQAPVIDTESDHNTRDTARRVARMYLMEVFAGRYGAQPPVTEFPNVGRLNELILPPGARGGRAAVNELYDLIPRDPRHRDITLLDYAEIGERRFATWRMGDVILNRVNLGTILRFSESPVLDPFQLSGKTALALLEELMASAALVSRDGA